MLKRGSKSSSRATLSDIASKVGVSISTVSLVLSNKAKERRLSDDVVQRVLQVASELDYSPNLLVHSLQKGRTFTLSFYNGFRERSKNDLYMDCLSTAIEQISGSYGYDILVYCVFDRQVEETYRNINGGRSDGLLFFAPMPDDPLLPYLRNSRMPCVIVGGMDDEGSLSHVMEDYRDGIRQVADKFIELGHKRIAILNNFPGGNPDSNVRSNLLVEILASRGIHIPNKWIVETNDNAETDAETALRFLMNEPEPPTACFCWHDRLGYQVLEACDRLGISIPGDLTFIGYDGLRWPAQTHHCLSSIKVDLNEIAYNSVVLLDDLIKGNIEGPVVKVVPVTLIEGTTMGPPKR